MRPLWASQGILVMEKKLLTIAEFCHIYGVGQTFTYDLIKAGKIKALKAGRKTMIPVEAAQEWADSLEELKLDGAPGGNRTHTP